MKVKHEAAVDVNAPAAESNQTLAMALDDSSAKTIEFLRARLLAERATSKSARQQAQEMSEKVKDLHILLETEVKQRKEAEAAMQKVLSVLKAKGVVMDSAVVTPTPLNAKSIGDVPPSDCVEETNEVSHHKTEFCCLEGIQQSMGNRDENSMQAVDCRTELHKNSSVVESTSNACGTTPAESEVCVPQMDSSEHRSGSMDQVQGVDHLKNVVCGDNRMHDGNPISKNDMQRRQSIQQGPCITTKLKTMLEQIEEEVCALPEEQPLRTKLQGLAGQLANMLERSQDAGLESRQPKIINRALEGDTALESDNGTHMKLPVQSKYGKEMDANEAWKQPDNQTHEMAEGIERRDRLVKRLFPSPKVQLQQQTDTVSSAGTLTPTPAKEDSSLKSNVFHERKPSCDSLNGGNRDAYAGHCLLDRGPLMPQVFQDDNSHLQITCPTMIQWSHFYRNQNHMGLDPPYLVEVPSPQSSDALSVGDNVGYTHRQHNEFWSPARALSGQSAWAPARLERQSRTMLSNGYFVNDNSNELLMRLDRGYYNHQNMYLQGGFPHSRSHSCQDSDLGNSMIRAQARQQSKDYFPFDDADDRKGKLGSILMGLDVARRQIIQGEEVMGSLTPTAVDARFKRFGGQQLPPEFQHDNRRRQSHAPIIQFPPSPTSEQGYSPFERSHSTHRRSSSVSTNFMMSEWDNPLEPSGEVHLGNGITLYTD